MHHVRKREDWGVLKRTLGNLSWGCIPEKDGLCSLEKEYWLSFLAYSSQGNNSAMREWVAGVARRFEQVNYPSSGIQYNYIHEWGNRQDLPFILRDLNNIFQIQIHLLHISSKKIYICNDKQIKKKMVQELTNEADENRFVHCDEVGVRE